MLMGELAANYEEFEFEVVRKGERSLRGAARHRPVPVTVAYALLDEKLALPYSLTLKRNLQSPDTY